MELSLIKMKTFIYFQNIDLTNIKYLICTKFLMSINVYCLK